MYCIQGVGKHLSKKCRIEEGFLYLRKPFVLPLAFHAPNGVTLKYSLV